MIWRAALWLSVLLAAAPAEAGDIVFQPEQEVVRSAIVAWVQIERAEPMHSPDGRDCGTRYDASVLQSVKGPKPGSRLQFGFQTGRRPGEQYVVFLAERARLLESSGREDRSTRLDGTRPSIAADPACRGVLPAYVETADGVGTIPVRAGRNANERPTVDLSSPSYLVRAELVAQRNFKGFVAGGYAIGDVEVEADVFLRYLASVSSAR